MPEMPAMEKKHAYGGRQCMACGGMACKISYEQLRDMVEKKKMGGNAGPMAKDDAGAEYDGDDDPAISMMTPLGRYADGGQVSSSGFPTIINQQTPDSNASNSKKLAIKMADGGDVEGSGDDDMLMDQCAHECMEAMKSGDKMAFKDAMTAMIHEIMEKMGE